MNISRRPATPADEEYARATHHAAYRDVVERQFGHWNEEQQDSFFEAGWATAQHDIVLLDGERVGYCAIEERPDDIHVFELVIAPAAQDRGIATRLLLDVQETARRLGRPVRLGTFHANRALALYSRLGFVPIGRTPTHVLMEWRAEARTH
jgi:ribosomal protein S18 acetylase RimI-like enzyme